MAELTDRTPDTRNPALADLQVLVGGWNVEISNTTFLPDPAATIGLQVSFDWMEGGTFLVARQHGGETAGVPNCVCVVSRDAVDEHYLMFYFDDRGVSRIYHMSLKSGTWKLWRNASGFMQRFTGAISKDGERIAGRWEKSYDDTTWEHDFDITYAKVPNALPRG